MANGAQHLISEPEEGKSDLGFVQHGAKRKMISPSPRDPRNMARPSANTDQTAVSTSNRFEALAHDDSMGDQDSAEAKKDRPPPIFMEDVRDYKKLCESIHAVVGKDFKCKSSSTGVTIYLSEPSQYRQLVTYLRTNNASFHTYQMKQDKPHRVVIRGLHWTTPVESIQEELTNLNFKVRSVVNVISRNKTPLPLFFVDLEPNTNFLDIYKIKDLLYTIVKVEELRRHRQIVQCTRCQNFNHTKAYCNHEPRCVKCAGPHLSTACTKNKDDPATCALCNNRHTSNYRGCTVYQELQRHRRSPTMSRRPLNSDTDVVNSVKPFGYNPKSFPTLQQNGKHCTALNQSSRNIGSNATDSSNLDHSNQQPSQNYINNNMNSSNVSQMFSNHQSYANIVRGQHHSADNQLDKVMNMMTSFLTDIKSIIMPLMSLLSQLSQVLVSQNGK